MYHTNRNDVIETSEDISDVLGVHVAEENGQKVATLKVLLDPRKDFLAVKDFFVHLTNGINHRLIGPLASVSDPAELPAAPAPVVESTEATPEVEAPATETPAITEAQGEQSTAEVAGTSEDTVKSSAVTPPSEGGK